MVAKHIHIYVHDGFVEGEHPRDEGGKFSAGAGFHKFEHGPTSIEYTVPKDGGMAEIGMVKTPPEARGQGHARRAMEQFHAHADQHGLTTFLTPEPMDKQTKQGKLEAFYKSVGYVRNHGRNKDFRSWASMLRPAVKKGGA